MAKQPKMITCKNCGKEIPENLKLCADWKKKIDDDYQNRESDR